MSDRVPSNAVDGDILSFFATFSLSANDWFQIDMLTSISIQSMYIAHYIVADNTQIEIYIGDTPAASGGLTANTQCHSGGDAGIIYCVGTGRYLIINEPNGGFQLQFSEIYAWDSPELAASLTTATLTGMSVLTGSLSNIFGMHDSTQDACVQFNKDSLTPVFEFDLPQVSQITGLMVQCGKGFCNISQLDVYVLNVADGTWVSCTSMSFSSGAVQYSTCTNTGGIRIKFTLTVSSSATEVSYLCKIAVFGEACNTSTPTIISTVFSNPSETFNLLTDSSLDVMLPVLETTPSGCFSITWNVYRTTDNVDMVTDSPTNFDLITLTDRLTISHVLGDFAERLSLFSNGPMSFYFQGTFSDLAMTLTPQYSFSVDFQDACRTASIVMTPGISDQSVSWGTSSASFPEPAFTDSLDIIYGPTLGICGGKGVVLDAGTTPAFLSKVPDPVSPLQNGFSIDFDGLIATEADIQIHTISYTITMLQYSAFIPSESSSFLFEIQCPLLVTSSSLDVPMETNIVYDVASGITMSLSYPDITVNPASCFTVDSFTVIDTTSLVLPEYIIQSSSAVNILTSDRSLLGDHTLQITAQVSSGESIQQHTFVIEFEDTCKTAELIDNAGPIQTIKIRALESEIYTESFESYTDSISTHYGLVNTCGPFEYSLLEPKPTFASAVLHDSQSEATSNQFQIEIDVSSFAQQGTFTLTLVVSLVNYPNSVPKVFKDFKVEVLPALNPWVPPIDAEEDDQSKQEQELPVIEEDLEFAVDTLPAVPNKKEPYRPSVEDQKLANLVRDSVIENQRAYPYPIPFISETTQTGKVIILITRALKEISPKLDLKTLEYEAEPNVWKPVFTVEIKPALTQDPQNVAMDWQIVKYGGSMIELKLIFEQPLYISFEKEPDELIVTFADEDLFITENGIKILPEHRVLTRKLMKQLPVDAVDLQQQLTSAAEGSQAAATAIFVANLSLAIGLQEIFGMIEALQIIILLPLMNANMPANAGMFFKELTAIAAFDVYETNDILVELLELLPTDPVSEKFETIGLETLYFMNNLGTFAIIIALKVLLVILWIVIKPVSICSKLIKKIRNRLGQSIFWNSWITIINESFVIVGLCAVISLKYNLEFEPWGQTFQTVVCISIMFIYVTLPLFAYFKSIREFDNLQNKEIKQRLGAFYEGKALRRGKKVLFHPVSFLARRLILVYLVVAGTKQLIYQMMILIGSTIVSAMILYQTEAFESAVERRLNTFSELVILLVSYCFFSFDLLDVESNFEVGYFPIMVMSIYILVCLLIVIVSNVKAIRLKVQLCQAKRYHRRKRKFLQGFLKMKHNAMRSRMFNLRLNSDQNQEDIDQQSSEQNEDSNEEYQASIDLNTFQLQQRQQSQQVQQHQHSDNNRHSLESVSENFSDDSESNESDDDDKQNDVESRSESDEHHSDMVENDKNSDGQKVHDDVNTNDPSKRTNTLKRSVTKFEQEVTELIKANEQRRLRKTSSHPPMQLKMQSEQKQLQNNDNQQILEVQNLLQSQETFDHRVAVALGYPQQPLDQQSQAINDNNIQSNEAKHSQIINKPEKLINEVDKKIGRTDFMEKLNRQEKPSPGQEQPAAAAASSPNVQQNFEIIDKLLELAASTNQTPMENQNTEEHKNHQGNLMISSENGMPTQQFDQQSSNVNTQEYKYSNSLQPNDTDENKPGLLDANIDMMIGDIDDLLGPQSFEAKQNQVAQEAVDESQSTIGILSQQSEMLFGFQFHNRVASIAPEQAMQGNQMRRKKERNNFGSQVDQQQVQRPSRRKKISISDNNNQ